MWKRFFAAFAFYFMFVSCPLLALAPDMLQETSSSIREKLTDLKKSSEIVTEQLTLLSESLQQSQIEAAEWKEQSTTLSSSLMSMTEQLDDCYDVIQAKTMQLEQAIEVCAILIFLLVVRIICMVIGFWLYVKGIKLPRWLDILL